LLEELAKGDWLVAHLIEALAQNHRLADGVTEDHCLVAQLLEALVQNHRLVDGVTPGLTAVLADDDDHDLIFVLAETLMED